MLGSRAEGSSPLATIEDIQRRLLRPSSRPSTSQISSISSSDGLGSHNSSQLRLSFRESLSKHDAKEIEKTPTKTKRKLEDYLDPFLLSTISSKIGVVKNAALETKPKREDFEWPVDELKVFLADSSSKNGANWRSNKAVDREKDNSELSGKGGDEGEESCTPFRRFERTILSHINTDGEA